MKRILLHAVVFLAFAVCNVNAQTTVNSKIIESMDRMEKTLSIIGSSLLDLNKRLRFFTDTFSSNQGLQLTPKQQRLLLTFEFLNRAETRLSTLKTLKIQLVEKETATRKKISQVDENLRQENLDLSLSGTTDAETVRQNRRQALMTEKNTLTNLLTEITSSIADIDLEVNQTELFVRELRQRLYAEIRAELLDDK